MGRKIRIGSRASRLAVVQSELVMAEIRKILPEADLELVTMKTTGDKILHKTLDKIGGKGLFLKELDAALLAGQVDICVHSLKDVPVTENPALPIGAYSVRELPADVLVFPKETSHWNPALPVGCASARRKMQFQQLYPEAVIQPVRGNVLTRLEKLDSGEHGALILAEAGLKRLGLSDRIAYRFSPEELVPAAGQGILAIQTRAGEYADLLARLHPERDHRFPVMIGTQCHKHPTAVLHQQRSCQPSHAAVADHQTGFPVQCSGMLFQLLYRTIRNRKRYILHRHLCLCLFSGRNCRSEQGVQHAVCTATGTCQFHRMSHLCDDLFFMQDLRMQTAGDFHDMLYRIDFRQNPPGKRLFRCMGILPQELCRRDVHCRLADSIVFCGRPAFLYGEIQFRPIAGCKQYCSADAVFLHQFCQNLPDLFFRKCKLFPCGNVCGIHVHSCHINAHLVVSTP